MDKLTVKFGSYATLLEENMTFNEATLFTNTVICGSDVSIVTIFVEFLHDPPEVYPEIELSLPEHMFIGCGNLTFSVEEIDGAFNRELTYKWEI